MGVWWLPPLPFESLTRGLSCTVGLYTCTPSKAKLLPTLPSTLVLWCWSTLSTLLSWRGWGCWAGCWPASGWGWRGRRTPASVSPGTSTPCKAACKRGRSWWTWQKNCLVLEMGRLALKQRYIFLNYSSRWWGRGNKTSTLGKNGEENWYIGSAAVGSLFKDLGL